MSTVLRVLKWTGGLVLGLVLVLLVAVFVLLGTNWGARRAVSLGAGLAGYTIDWQAARGTLWQGMEFDALSLQGPDLQLSVGEGGFRWQPGRLSDRELQIDRLWLHEVQLQLPPAAANEAPADPLQPETLENLFAELPLAVQVDALSLQGLSVQQGELRFALERLAASLQLQSAGARVQVAELALYDAELAGSLALQANLDVAAEVDWRYALEPELRGRLQLGGNLRSLELQHSLAAPATVESRGSLVPGIFADAPLRLDLQHAISRLDLADFGVEDVVLESVQLRTSGPLDALDVSGSLGVQALQFAPAEVQLALLYDGSVVNLENLAIASEELRLSLQGRYAIDGSNGEVDWTLDALNPGAWLQAVELEGLAGSGSLAFSHDSAGVDASLDLGPLSGTLNGYPLDLAGTVLLRDSQPDTVDLRLSSGANTLLLDGNVLPELALDWDVDITAPENFWQGLAGRLQGAGRLEGQLPVPLVNGNLEGEGLSLRLAERRYQLETLQLQAEVVGGNANALELQLAGLQITDADSAPVEWLESATLALRGNPGSHALQLMARGRDSELRLALEGEQSGDEWQGEVLDADLQSPWGALQLRAPVALQYGAAGFAVPQHCWDLMPMTLCLEAASSANGAVDAVLSLQALPLHWFNAGTVEERPPALQSLLLQYGLALPVGTALAGTAGIEAAVTGLVDNQWQALEARARVENATLRVEAAIDELSLEEDEAPPEDLLLALRDPLLQLSSDGANWQADLQLAVEQVAEGGNGAGNPLFPRSSITGELAMDADEVLAGSLRLDFPSLDWLQALLPTIREPRGRATGNIRISGTRTEPRFDAGLNVREGGFRVPQLGLDIQSLEADLEGTPELANVRVDLRDAQGNLQLQASLRDPLSDSRALEASLAGERFTLMDNAAAEVEVSPDLELAWSAQGLQASGSLRVPRARIMLDEWVDNVGSGGVSPSRDAVVVVEDADALVAESGTALPLEAQVQLALGEEVRVLGLGLEARLGGELQLQQEPDRPLLVYGELSIPEGSYEIYNQTLQTRDGRLLFFGNPLDPVLDLRAFRETPNAEVGLQLRGNVSALESSLYSTPTMPEGEILSLLITGKSFRDTDQGDNDALVSAVANFGIERTTGLTSAIGDTLGLDDVSISGGSSYLDSSLGMGKYLTPDLLMRYEIGLFGRQAVFSLTYSLTERLKLEVRSGLSQSVDISYAIEKD